MIVCLFVCPVLFFVFFSISLSVLYCFLFYVFYLIAFVIFVFVCSESDVCVGPPGIRVVTTQVLYPLIKTFLSFPRCNEFCGF